jgi:hypothetical protein
MRYLRAEAPWHQGMEQPQAADGFQVWTEAADTMKRRSRVADKGRSSSPGVGRR